MKYFCGSINPNGKWNIFKFFVGERDSFYAHLKMEHGDIIVLVVGKQDPEVHSGAYAILKCVGDIYKVEEKGKIRNRINAECLYNSGTSPFITREVLESYIYLPIRVPIIVKKDIDKFSILINKFL